jgi:hypothetical protein
MDTRLHAEIAQAHGTELVRRAEERRRHWPDDGLPPNLASARRDRSTYPAVVLASLLAR